MFTTTTAIQYRLSVPNPRSHYFHVEAHFPGPFPEEFEVALPVWTPGSYLVREYARHLINLTARNGKGSLPIQEHSKSSWLIQIPTDTGELVLTYDVYAYELTVRTSYLDQNFGLAQGTTLFLYHPLWTTRPHRLTLDLPTEWSTSATLDGEHAVTFPDYDSLVDTPIQMGRRLTHYPFTVQGIPHELWVAGLGCERLPKPSFLEDLTRIIEAGGGIFGALPYSQYQFLVTITEAGGGGLEHKNSANIMVTPKLWRQAKDYRVLLSLMAHEFFHLWNVKRLRPHVLGPFDYQLEVYTTLLWALEGLTDYFAPWLLAHSQVVPVDEILAHWATQLKTLESTPGRFLTPLDRASQEAWIRHYRPDANTPNITVSYYLKGALVGLFLDLELLAATNQKIGLKEVFRELWRRYGEGGYPEPAFEDLLVEMGGAPMARVLASYVHGTDPFDESILNTVGLRLERTFSDTESEEMVSVGLNLVDRQGRLLVRQVERGGPGENAGVSPEDEVLALNGERIATEEQWKEALRHLTPGQSASLVIAHNREVIDAPLVPAEPRPDRYRLLPVEQPSPAQQKAFERWLGVPFPENRESDR